MFQSSNNDTHTNVFSPSWLTEDLQKQLRDIFEPRYGRKLTNIEVAIIADNLTEVMETFFKMKWRLKYEKSKT